MVQYTNLTTIPVVGLHIDLNTEKEAIMANGNFVPAVKQDDEWKYDVDQLPPPSYVSNAVVNYGKYHFDDVGNLHFAGSADVLADYVGNTTATPIRADGMSLQARWGGNVDLYDVWDADVSFSGYLSSFEGNLLHNLDLSVGSAGSIDLDNGWGNGFEASGFVNSLRTVGERYLSADMNYFGGKAVEHAGVGNEYDINIASGADLLISGSKDPEININTAFFTEVQFLHTNGGSLEADGFYRGEFLAHDGSDANVKVGHTEASQFNFSHLMGGSYEGHGSTVVDMFRATDMKVDTGSGADTIIADDSEATILSGAGPDTLHLNGSRVAYKPEAGEDTVYVRGGETFGNLAGDDAKDTLIFSAKEGGNHTAIVGAEDEVWIQDLWGGQWASDDIGKITTGNPDMISMPAANEGDELNISLLRSGDEMIAA